ncbi:hypothetical protein FCV25MIE_27841 [Fagus crenata]
MEFISALAAGKRARLMMEITSDGITPLTIAVAVAAKQTGGQLISIGHEDYIEKSKALLLIDCQFQDHLKIFKTINLNPSGSTLVVNNLHRRRDRISFAGVVEGRNCGVKCVTLPIGEGMDFTRIGSTSKREISSRYKRFHVTYEN